MTAAAASRGGVDGPPSHLDLLDLAGDIRHAVVRDDIDRVHVLLCELRTALVEHLQGERDDLRAMPGSLGAVVANGQLRLLALVDEAILGTDDPTHGCNCLVRGARIDAALRRQALLESRVVGGRAR